MKTIAMIVLLAVCGMAYGQSLPYQTDKSVLHCIKREIYVNRDNTMNARVDTLSNLSVVIIRSVGGPLTFKTQSEARKYTDVLLEMGWINKTEEDFRLQAMAAAAAAAAEKERLLEETRKRRNALLDIILQDYNTKKEKLENDLAFLVNAADQIQSESLELLKGKAGDPDTTLAYQGLQAKRNEMNIQINRLAEQITQLERNYRIQLRRLP